MTQTTKEIFESHEVRKTGKQKCAFRKFAVKTAEDMGYTVRVESGALGAKNVIVGNEREAKLFFTAHYDTAPILPFPNIVTPRSIILYVLYQLAITVALFVAPVILVSAALFGLSFLGVPGEILDKLADITWVLIFIEMLFIIAGPANKHTANDNTSGITLLFDIMRDLPEDLRDKVAFIFFDLEEVGLIGSSSYSSKHKDMADKLVVNFDCVSDGRNILFAANKNARIYKTAFEEAFKPNDDYTVEFHSKGVVYPSDQMSFKMGVGVSALNKTKKGILYMDKIHTAKDTVYDEKNIEFLKSGAISLAGALAPSDNAKGEPDSGKIEAE